MTSTATCTSFSNDHLDARNFLASCGPLKQNQFGGTLGGPVRRTKTSFRLLRGISRRQGVTQSATVPVTPSAGDFQGFAIRKPAKQYR